MASQAEIDAAAEAHRQAQVRNAAIVALLVLQFWRSVRHTDITRTARVWLTAILPYLLAGRRRSAQLAAAYANTVRRIEIGDIGRPSIPYDRPNLQQIHASLNYTGPGLLRQRLDRLGPAPTDAEIAEVVRKAGQGAAAAAVRHVQNAGRDTIVESVRTDIRALGYIRVTRGTCCYFCAMLASRGPVYKDDSFAESNPRFIGEGDYKVHDHCYCTLQPVYSRRQPWPGRAKEFEDLWKSATVDLSGKAAINAFRHALEHR